MRPPLWSLRSSAWGRQGLKSYRDGDGITAPGKCTVPQPNVHGGVVGLDSPNPRTQPMAVVPAATGNAEEAAAVVSFGVLPVIFAAHREPAHRLASSFEAPPLRAAQTMSLQCASVARPPPPKRFPATRRVAEA